ncbi:hypothetical protein [Pseudoduganella rhizocola]|uniref:hypothetical protein n=1 Tax=Pseudoduganella rhizocola TaxID=3382643 RepID=UPI0038B69EC2
MKKFAVFLFALGVGMTALAGEECYLACEDKYDACIEAGTNPRGCLFQYDKCMNACDIGPGV